MNTFFEPRAAPAGATARFMLRHPAHLLAFGFGSGLAPVAPGTVGTLFGWALYDFVLARLAAWDEPATLFVALAFAFAVGVHACQRTGRALGVSDHGAMVWDEIVAIVLVLSLLPQTLAWQAAGVALFRFFDIRKPVPIRAFERRYKNGFGVMGDDLIAAFYTLLVLAVFKAVAS